VRRNRAAVVAAAAVLCALVAGLVAALWQSREAGRQRDLAVNVASTMVFELAEGLNRMVGPSESRLGLLNRAAEVFEGIGVAGGATAEQQRRTADAYRMLAQTYFVLGETERALHYIGRAEEVARRLASRTDSQIEDQVVLANVLLNRGDVLAQGSREQEATAAYGEALALTIRSEARPGAFPNLHRIMYLLLSRKADRLYYVGQLDSASVLYQQGFAIAGRLVSHDGTNPEFQSFRASILDRLADVLYYSGRVDESCVRYRETLALRQQLSAQIPNDVAALRNLSISLQNAGWCSEQEGDTGEAVRLYGEGIAIQRRLFGNDPSNVLAATNLMGGLGEQAKTLFRLGRQADAERHFREALSIGDAFHARGVADPRVVLKTAQIGQLFAVTLLETRQLAAAESVLGRMQTLLTDLIRREPANQEYPRSLAEGLLIQGELQRQRQNAGGALAHLAEALRVYRGIAEASGMSTDWQKVGLAHHRYARALREAGQAAHARRTLLEGRRILRDLQAAGQLSETSDGYREYLPQIERALRELPG
jgi:tetratricopeptide (TPR) repeat protein